MNNTNVQYNDFITHLYNYNEFVRSSNENYINITNHFIRNFNNSNPVNNTHIRDDYGYYPSNYSHLRPRLYYRRPYFATSTSGISNNVDNISNRTYNNGYTPFTPDTQQTNSQTTTANVTSTPTTTTTTPITPISNTQQTNNQTNSNTTTNTTRQTSQNVQPNTRFRTRINNIIQNLRNGSIDDIGRSLLRDAFTFTNDAINTNVDFVPYATISFTIDQSFNIPQNDETENRILTQDEINQTIQDISYNQHTTRQTVCPIGLNDFREGQLVSRINGCNHIFIRENLLRWLNTSTRCPVCRHDILDDLNNDSDDELDVEEYPTDIDDEDNDDDDNDNDNNDNNNNDLLDELLDNEFSTVI